MVCRALELNLPLSSPKEARGARLPSDDGRPRGMGGEARRPAKGNTQGHRPAYVLAKIDVEGAEFEVMPKLLAAGLLCADAISTITMEWHPGFLSLMGARERGLRHLPTAAEGGQLMQRVSSARASVPTAAGSTCSRKTTFESVDDETYLLDSKCSLRLHEEPSRVCSAPADKECAHMYPSADGPAA